MRGGFAVDLNRISLSLFINVEERLILEKYFVVFCEFVVQRNLFGETSNRYAAVQVFKVLNHIVQYSCFHLDSGLRLTPLLHAKGDLVLFLAYLGILRPVGEENIPGTRG